MELGALTGFKTNEILEVSSKRPVGGYAGCQDKRVFRV